MSPDPQNPLPPSSRLVAPSRLRDPAPVRAWELERVAGASAALAGLIGVGLVASIDLRLAGAAVAFLYAAGVTLLLMGRRA